STFTKSGSSGSTLFASGFLSNRTRTTSAIRGISADDCAADITGSFVAGGGAGFNFDGGTYDLNAGSSISAGMIGIGGATFNFNRSEERRVGKECRSRGSAKY